MGFKRHFGDFLQRLIFKFVSAVALLKGCEMATMTASAVMVDVLSRLQSLALKCAVIRLRFGYIGFCRIFRALLWFSPNRCTKSLSPIYRLGYEMTGHLTLLDSEPVRWLIRWFCRSSSMVSAMLGKNHTSDRCVVALIGFYRMGSYLIVLVADFPTDLGFSAEIPHWWLNFWFGLFCRHLPSLTRYRWLNRLGIDDIICLQ